MPCYYVRLVGVASVALLVGAAASAQTAAFQCQKIPAFGQGGPEQLQVRTVDQLRVEFAPAERGLKVIAHLFAMISRSIMGSGVPCRASDVPAWSKASRAA